MSEILLMSCLQKNPRQFISAAKSWLPRSSGTSISVKVRKGALSVFSILGSCTSLFPPPTIVLIQNASYIIASIARLSYVVEYVQVNVEDNYQVKFAGRLSFSQDKNSCARLNTITIHGPGRQHDHVLRHRSLCFHHLR